MVANEPGEPGDANGEGPATEAPPVMAPPTAPTNPDLAAHRPVATPQFSTWDFLSLAVAALVAYELGRGTGGARTVPVDAGPSEPVPANTHPDA